MSKKESVIPIFFMAEVSLKLQLFSYAKFSPSYRDTSRLYGLSITISSLFPIIKITILLSAYYLNSLNQFFTFSNDLLLVIS